MVTLGHRFLDFWGGWTSGTDILSGDGALRRCRAGVNGADTFLMAGQKFMYEMVAGRIENVLLECAVMCSGCGNGVLNGVMAESSNVPTVTQATLMPVHRPHKFSAQYFGHGVRCEAHATRLVRRPFQLS